MEPVRAKGINFRSFASALRRIRGDVALSKALTLVPHDLGEAMRLGAITTVGWYPTEWYAQLHAAAQKACGEGAELARAIGHESITEDFRTGVHRLVAVTLSPGALFKLAQRIIGLYWDGAGRAVVEESEGGRALGRFEGFHGFNHDLWEDVVGASMGILELGGAKNVVPRVLAGGQDGDAHMIFSARWTE